MFTPDEMVRLEILQYENPECLHPVEAAWRNLCRKLVRQTMAAEQRCQKALQSQRYVSNEDREYKPFKFPSAFTPEAP